MTQRQAYWLSCLEEALARLQAQLNQPIPASLSHIAKVDRARHNGMATAHAGTIVATMVALSQRRWVDIGTIPPLLKLGDGRASTRAYRLADRRTLRNDSALLLETFKKRDSLERHVDKLKRILQTEEVPEAVHDLYAKTVRQFTEAETTIRELQARIDAERYNVGEFTIDVPPDQMPQNILLASCVIKPGSPATNPYHDPA